MKQEIKKLTPIEWWYNLPEVSKKEYSLKYSLGKSHLQVTGKEIDHIYLSEHPQKTYPGNTVEVREILERGRTYPLSISDKITEITIPNTVSSERFFTDGEKWLQKDQNIFSIRKDGEVLGYIESKNGYLVTTGSIGENTYKSFVDLIKGLQGYGIAIDNFYW